MSLLQLLVLSIIQGVAEFLPISSSGHLNLTQFIFSLQPSLTLDIFLNTATLFSVLFFFRHKIKYFFNNFPFIIIGSLPAAFIGFFFKSEIDKIFSTINLLPLFFLITSVLVLATKFLKSNDQKITPLLALIIGFFQALAILPGVSRAGSTIFAGLLLGLSPLNAFNFAFCLYLPASIGAIFLSLRDLTSNGFFNLNYFFIFLVTLVVGFFSLSFLQKALQSKKYYLFGFYTLSLSLATFVYFNILPFFR